MNNKYPTTKPSLNLDFANTKSLDPRITFRRGTPGKYYDGVTHAKAEENLFDYSEDFSQWANQREELTAGQSAPDGSSGAYKVAQASGQVNPLTISRVVNMNKGENYTYSIYAKAGTNRDYLNVRIYDYSISDYYQFFLFDLGNGQTLDNAGKNIDYYGGAHEIQDAGNGWYRCIVNFPVVNDSSSGFTITNYVTDAPLYLADGLKQVADDGGFIYLWGAQLEQRDTVTSYTATTGTPITKYQPKLMTAAADNARFDHDPITGESKGLLIEEQRTNLIAYSEDFSSGAWVTNDASIKTDCVIAPDGTLTADKLVENTNSAQHLVAQLFNFQNGTSYTFSIFAKKGESEAMFFNITNLANVLGSQPVYAKADLNDGTIQLLSGNDASVGSEDVGNGWFRFTITGTCTVTASAWLGVRTYDSTGSTTNYLGDGYSGLYIWGAQLETSSFATSYIKTTGASATRSADNASITGENFSSWYRQDEGSIYYESSAFQVSEYRPQGVTLSDGTNNNRIVMHAGTSAHLYVTKNNTNIVDIDATQNNQDNVYSKKIACFKSNNFSVCIDGQDVASDTTGETPIVDRMHISAGYAGNLETGDSSHVKKIAYYPQRLTNEQLQNLTK